MLEFDYAYISDPPMFADIGTAFLGVEGMTIEFTWTSTFDETFEIMITDLTLQFGPDQPHPTFDGISDFSVLASNMATTICAVVRNRLVSLIDSQLLTPKINQIANKIIQLFPSQIPIGPLDVVGILAGNPTSTSVWTHIPMSTYVTSEQYPYDMSTCTAQIPEVVPSPY